MSGLEPASEVEVAKMANGSGPSPEDMGVEVVIEKDCEEKNGDEKKDGENEDGNEKSDGEEKKDREGTKEGEENGMEKMELAEEGKEEKKTVDVNTEEAEDVKMVDAEDLKTVETKDVTMVDEEDAKDVEEGVKEVGEEEGGTESNWEKVNDVKEDKDSDNIQKKVDENKVEGLKKKRARGQKGSNKGEAKEKKGRGTKSKELLSTPTPSSIDRPVRERKTVERLVEVIEKEPNKEFLVEKGRGTPLKDIPNVAYKLARKKPADLKLLHQTLFGRKGKAINFKNHILQFSGFVWHESDEKQRAKMKEKLDKYVKDTLLDLCDLFDIAVSKATMRKEDLVAKLLDFMVAPHPTTDVILAEKEQSMKSRKRKRMTKGSASKSLGGTSTKQSRKKQTKSEETSNSKGKSAQDEDEEDNENSVSEDDQALKQSESEAKESESEEAADEDEDVDEDSEKSKEDKKRSRQRSSGGKGKSKVETSSRKSSFSTTTKILAKTPSSKRPKAEEDKDVGAKVFSRKKKIVEAAKKKSTPKSDKKEKATGKKVARGKAKSVGAEYPSEEELRKTICEILKEVDFNTATFTDILKQLATHYKMDLTLRKPAIKELIQEELTKLADELDESEDDEDEDEDDDKEEIPEPSGKRVKT